MRRTGNGRRTCPSVFALLKVVNSAAYTALAIDMAWHKAWYGVGQVDHGSVLYRRVRLNAVNKRQVIGGRLRQTVGYKIMMRGDFIGEDVVYRQLHHALRGPGKRRARRRLLDDDDAAC